MSLIMKNREQKISFHLWIKDMPTVVLCQPGEFAGIETLVLVQWSMLSLLG